MAFRVGEIASLAGEVSDTLNCFAPHRLTPNVHITMHRIAILLIAVVVLFASRPLIAAEIELTESLDVAESHTLGWARDNSKPDDSKPDDKKAGRWVVDPELWKEAVAKKGAGKLEKCNFHLWVPAGVEFVRGVVAITGHGSGTPLYKHAELRAIARELKLALFMFDGNPMQRGFWPTTLLYDRLREFGAKAKHPEIEHAPLFLYGHSNGTGFSAVFTSTEAPRVWGWISMRPGTTQQVEQPGGAQVPGMVMFGENDPYFAQRSKQQNIGTVETMRKDHAALWHCVVEPGTGHGPGEKSWTLVFSFLKHSFAARVPSDADPRNGPVKLIVLKAESGYLGKNWDITEGGYQTLAIEPAADFAAGDKATASWLVNADYAADWQKFQAQGYVGAPKAK